MTATERLRVFEVDPGDPFARFSSRDNAPGWLVGPIAFGLFVGFVGLLVICSPILLLLERSTVLLVGLPSLFVLLALMFVFEKRRGERIVKALRSSGTSTVQAVFAVRPRLNRWSTWGTSIAFCADEIVVAHRDGTRGLTRLAHSDITRLQHRDRALVNHLIVHTPVDSYQFSLWPRPRFPPPPFLSVFTRPRSRRTPDSEQLKELLARTGLPWSTDRVA